MNVQALNILVWTERALILWSELICYFDDVLIIPYKIFLSLQT